MKTNADITIYNRGFDPIERVERWYKTILRGVSWRGKRKLHQRGLAIAEEDAISIRIPENVNQGGKSYLPPFVWAKLKREECFCFWTVQSGDSVFYGALDEAPCETDSLSDLSEEYPQRITVFSEADNRDSRLSERMRHWKVTGR
jgi:hypothetical protein